MSIFGKRRLFCIKNVKVMGDYYLYIRMKAEDVVYGENIFLKRWTIKGEREMPGGHGLTEVSHVINGHKYQSWQPITIL